MTDRIIELLQEYDDLVAGVTNSTPNFYQDNLGRWFSLIDETPDFARLTVRLEVLNDFDAWYDDLVKRKKSHGMGAPPFNLPPDRDAALGTKISLFRRMAQGTIKPAIFAHTYISSDGNLNMDVQALSQQLFYPMTRDLRRHLLNAVPPQGDDDIVPFLLPAADRVVPLNHNSQDYADAIEQLDRLEELIRTTNDYPDSDDRDRQVAEISATKRLLSAAMIRAEVAVSLAYKALKYLAKKFIDTMIGKLASSALALIGKITGLW
jgi:hypothetical protein